jgi:putative membrane protein
MGGTINFENEQWRGTEENMTESTRASSRTFKDYIGITLRGFVMGAADVVPGVSGGTMAFILGIYEELIGAIRTFTMPEIWKLALRFDIKALVERLPWKFLLALSGGILAAIFSLAQFLEYALDNYPSLLWAFFFGLVVASVVTIIHRVRVWNGISIAAAIVGALPSCM